MSSMEKTFDEQMRRSSICNYLLGHITIEKLEEELGRILFIDKPKRWDIITLKLESGDEYDIIVVKKREASFNSEGFDIKRIV